MKDSYLSYVRHYMEQEEKYGMKTPLYSLEEYADIRRVIKESREINQLSNLPRDIAMAQTNISYQTARRMVRHAREAAAAGEWGGGGKIPTISELRAYKGTSWTYTHEDGTTEEKTGTTAQALYMNYMELYGREEANAAFGY